MSVIQIPSCFSSFCGVLPGENGPQTAIQQNKYLPQSFKEMECVLLQALCTDCLICTAFYCHEFASLHTCLPVVAAECIVGYNLEFYSYVKNQL